MSDNSFVKKYEKELQGQVEFLQKYLVRVDSSLNISDVQHDYSDGVINGNLIEFKLVIENSFINEDKGETCSFKYIASFT